jgi:hypothetical protein
MKDQDVQTQDSNEEVEETTVETPEETLEETQETNETVVEEPKERPVYHMPVAKAQEQKEKAVQKALDEANAKWEERLARIEQSIQGKPTTDDELSKWAEENGMDAKAAESLLNLVEKRVGSKIPTDQLNKALEQSKYNEAKMQVATEFDTNVVPMIIKDYPNASAEHIRKIKEEVEKLAFSKGFNTYRLEDIYKLNSDKFEYKNKYTAEPPTGKSNEYVNFSQLSDKEEHELAENDPETFRKYLKWQDASGSRYLD